MIAALEDAKRKLTDAVRTASLLEHVRLTAEQAFRVGELVVELVTAAQHEASLLLDELREAKLHAQEDEQLEDEDVPFGNTDTDQDEPA